VFKETQCQGEALTKSICHNHVVH